MQVYIKCSLQKTLEKSLAFPSALVSSFPGTGVYYFIFLHALDTSHNELHFVARLSFGSPLKQK